MGVKCCKLSRNKQVKLLKIFVAEVNARTAAELFGVNYHTAHLFYLKIRKMITYNIEDEMPFDGCIKVDESYFGGVYKGKRDQGAACKLYSAF